MNIYFNFSEIIDITHVYRLLLLILHFFFIGRCHNFNTLVKRLNSQKNIAKQHMQLYF